MALLNTPSLWYFVFRVLTNLLEIFFNVHSIISFWVSLWGVLQRECTSCSLLALLASLAMGTGGHSVVVIIILQSSEDMESLGLGFVAFSKLLFFVSSNSEPSMLSCPLFQGKRVTPPCPYPFSLLLVAMDIISALRFRCLLPLSLQIKAFVLWGRREGLCRVLCPSNVCFSAPFVLLLSGDFLRTLPIFFMWALVGLHWEPTPICLTCLLPVHC